MNQLYPEKLVAVVLDDDEDTRFAIGRILAKCGCDVFEASTVDAAMALMADNKADVVFSDLRLPGEAGGEKLLSVVLKDHPDVNVVLMSCAMGADTRIRLMKAGALDCLKKPFYKDTCQQILASLKVPLKKFA